MREKTILLVCLLFFFVGLSILLIKMKKPRYIKSKGFLKMHDNPDGCVGDTSADKFIVTHHYTKCLFVEERGDANEIF